MRTIVVARLPFIAIVGDVRSPADPNYGAIGMARAARMAEFSDDALRRKAFRGWRALRACAPPPDTPPPPPACAAEPLLAALDDDALSAVLDATTALPAADQARLASCCRSLHTQLAQCLAARKAAREAAVAREARALEVALWEAARWAEDPEHGRVDRPSRW